MKYFNPVAEYTYNKKCFSGKEIPKVGLIEVFKQSYGDYDQIRFCADEVVFKTVRCEGNNFIASNYRSGEKCREESFEENGDYIEYRVVDFMHDNKDECYKTILYVKKGINYSEITKQNIIMDSKYNKIGVKKITSIKNLEGSVLREEIIYDEKQLSEDIKSGGILILSEICEGNDKYISCLNVELGNINIFSSNIVSQEKYEHEITQNLHESEKKKYIPSGFENEAEVLDSYDTYDYHLFERGILENTGHHIDLFNPNVDIIGYKINSQIQKTKMELSM